jgi:pyrroloquinoline quinone biosynthesis protein D
MTEISVASRPTRQEGLWLRESGDETVLLDRSTSQMHVLNETALALWQLCDGETTVEEMLTAAGNLFDADADELEHDVLDALTAMRDRGIIRVP